MTYDELLRRCCEAALDAMLNGKGLKRGMEEAITLAMTWQAYDPHAQHELRHDLRLLRK